MFKRITTYVWHTKNESMDNSIASVALKNKTIAHITSPNNRILCIVGISIFGFKKYWQVFFNLIGINISPTFKQFLQAETDNAKKILSRKWCKKNESLPQVGNDETSNIRKHTCKAKWDGLQFRNMLSNKYFQHVRSKITHQEKSTGENKPEARKTVPVWLHQTWTNYLKWLLCGNFLLEIKK